MSSLNNLLESEVVNTYPLAVDYTIWYINPTAAAPPLPGPTSLIPPNTIQDAGSGNVDHIVLRYRDTAASPVTEVSIPYGAPIDPHRRINVLWNTNETTQVIVIVETSITGDRTEKQEDTI